jgi:hypothetical protein
MLKHTGKKLVFLILLISVGFSRQIAVIEVSLQKAEYDLYIPIKIKLDEITFIDEKHLELNRISENKKIPVPFQIKKGEKRLLYWLINPSRAEKFTYELIQIDSSEKYPELKLKKEDGLLIIQAEKRNILGYQFETKYPPAGVDSAFKRSAFIHPLWSPKGQVLTRIQPPDHYHHYGIWNPWTHVLFEGDTLDFWNLYKKQGTVRFNKFISLTEGPVFAEFQAVHEHVAFKNDGTQKVALNELQTVRVYSPQENHYFFDLTIHLSCPGDIPVKLLEYRYGGFGWRTTEQWHKDNSEMLSSGGKTRIDIDNTTGTWFYVQGETDKDYAGALVMSYPSNFNQPQPMRMWGIPQEGRGDVFASFSPTRDTDWLIEPGKNYVLNYRFVVYNGRFNSQMAEQSWKYYANPPAISVRKSQGAE